MLASLQGLAAAVADGGYLVYTNQPWHPQQEFIARAALGKALVLSAKGGTEEAARAIRTFSFTKVYRRTLWKARVINALPVRWRSPLLDLYNALAWRIARKGL